MENYIASFNQNVWKKLKVLASLENQTMTDWVNQKIRENINNIEVKNYQEDKNYKKKKN